MKRDREQALPEAGEGKRGPDGHVGYLLRQAAAAHRLRMDRALADLEVTPPQFAVLTMLNSYPGRSNAEIARLALLTPQTTSVIVANLQRAGLVRRQPHAEHGRILQVELTPAGQARLQACRIRIDALESHLMEGASAEQAGTIRRWLSEVSRPSGRGDP